MKQYLDIVRHVLDNGVEKYPTRRNPNTGEWEPVDGGVKTLACANVLFSHEMEDGFPLLTTKKVAWKSVRVELEGFIRGITSKKWYKDRGCNIWNEWANPEVVRTILDEQASPFGGSIDYNSPLAKDIKYNEDDLGAIYGYSWRRFNQAYDENDNGWVDESCKEDADQLKRIVDTLLNNPMDRRMVCSAWNPLQMSRMALPPCHWGWNVTVIGNKLNLCWIQRSVDVPYGLPFNIASYALLLCLLVEAGGFKRGNLSAMLVDCHIYENQIDGCNRQIKREPRELPELYLDDFNGIFNWTYDKVRLEGYNPMEKIDFGQIVV